MDIIFRFIVILLTISMPFVAVEYRLGPLAFYDIFIILMWLLLVINLGKFNFIPRELSNRSFFLLLAYLFFGGIATWIGFNFYNLDIQLLDLFKILAGLALYFGITLICIKDRKILNIIIIIFSINAAIQGILALKALDGSTRYVGTFIDPNYFATFQSVVLVILISIFIDKKKTKFSGILLLLLIILTILSIILSFSRGAYLQLIICLVIFILYKYKKNIVKLSFYFFGFIILLYVFIQIISKYFADSKWISRLSFSEIVEKGGSGRTDIWLNAIQKTIDNPFGYGWGSEVQINGIGSHNIFIEALVQFGVPGLIIFVILYLTFIKEIFSILKYSSSSLEIGIALSGIIMLIASLTLGILEYRQFWFCIGLVSATAYNVRRKLVIKCEGKL